MTRSIARALAAGFGLLREWASAGRAFRRLERSGEVCTVEFPFIWQACAGFMASAWV
jgi:hypothetical protein